MLRATTRLARADYLKIINDYRQKKFDIALKYNVNYKDTVTSIPCLRDQYPVPP